MLQYFVISLATDRVALASSSSFGHPLPPHTLLYMRQETHHEPVARSLVPGAVAWAEARVTPACLQRTPFHLAGLHRLGTLFEVRPSNRVRRRFRHWDENTGGAWFHDGRDSHRSNKRRVAMMIYAHGDCPATAKRSQVFVDSTRGTPGSLGFPCRELGNIAFRVLCRLIKKTRLRITIAQCTEANGKQCPMEPTAAQHNHQCDYRGQTHKRLPFLSTLGPFRQRPTLLRTDRRCTRPTPHTRKRATRHRVRNKPNACTNTPPNTPTKLSPPASSIRTQLALIPFSNLHTSSASA